MTKTIKIPEGVHRELKIYVANKSNVTIEDVAGLSIMQYLKSVGHKFANPKKQKG